MINCRFENGGEFCRWNIDPRDQTAIWESMNYGPKIGDAACMSPNGGESAEAAKHSARLWSPWLKFSKKAAAANSIKCLQFVYRIDNVKRSNSWNRSNASLALLKHSKG